MLSLLGSRNMKKESATEFVCCRRLVASGARDQQKRVLDESADALQSE